MRETKSKKAVEVIAETPKKKTSKAKKQAEQRMEIYGLEPLPEKELVTTPTFNETPRHEWNSEIDVCEFIGSLIKMIGAKAVLEVGVFEGETALKMIDALPNGGYYAGIDINDHRKHSLERGGVAIDFILGQSIDVMKAMTARHFDFIFVDGDHSWKNILPEFKEVERVIAKGGVIAYHDSIHLPDVKELMKYAAHYKYNVVTLNTSEGRGLSILQRL
jgi:predicted O-methyltransferase YrrM